jgi:hypothetical protein
LLLTKTTVCFIFQCCFRTNDRRNHCH